jgi:hypothetical protein
MNKIINGKKYDTETAEECFSYWNGYHCTDLGYAVETLYRKKTGEFFLFGKGGAKSKYAISYGNGCSGHGSRITPFAEHQARQWLESHSSGEEFEAIFGPVPE